jgi:hypothetical protein
MMKEYLDYIRDNPKRYWFRARLYGWGWTPARWQGWLVLFGFFAFLLINFYRLDSASDSESDALIYLLPETWLAVFVLLAICWKTGEWPRWQWGPPKKDI